MMYKTHCKYSIEHKHKHNIRAYMTGL